MNPEPLPQPLAIVSAFAETMDGRWINASHIVSLVKIPDMEAYVATLATMQTYRVSSYITEQLLRGAVCDLASKAAA